MDILIVDDSNDKIVNLVSLVRGLSEEINVVTANDSISAQKILKENKFDLLLLDLLLPLRPYESPKPEGGKNLVREIERNFQLKSPTYIVAITQFEEYLNDFSPIWNVLHYTPSSTIWKDQLTLLFSHILKSKQSRAEIPKQKKPTVFLEGKCDHRLLQEAIKLFSPQLQEKLILRSEQGSGASWVARQIIIWASTLAKAEGKYVKSIGILDGDPAGNYARNEINRVISPSSAGSNTFKIIQLSPTYARDIIPLYAHGLNIPVTLEEMIPDKYWKRGFENGWLEKRNEPDTLLKDPKKWDKMNVSLKDYIESLGLTNEQMIYLKKFKNENKEQFARSILSLDKKERIDSLRNFKAVINDIETFLFP